MSKETFKSFIKTRPDLAKAVLDGKTTYQKLYETYDMYGENSSAFNSFRNNSLETKSTSTIKEIGNLIGTIDLETFQKGVNGLQKAVNLISEIVPKNNNDYNYPYEERPINKYYED